jgi:hypothetical protein
VFFGRFAVRCCRCPVRFGIQSELSAMVGGRSLVLGRRQHSCPPSLLPHNILAPRHPEGGRAADWGICETLPSPSFPFRWANGRSFRGCSIRIRCVCTSCRRCNLYVPCKSIGAVPSRLRRLGLGLRASIGRLVRSTPESLSTSQSRLLSSLRLLVTISAGSPRER